VPTTPDPGKEQEYRKEAERLAQLPLQDQQKALAIIRAPADDSKLGKRDREAARQRAEALKRHLRRLNRQRKPES
jgi:hypothetical protein